MAKEKAPAAAAAAAAVPPTANGALQAIASTHAEGKKADKVGYIPLNKIRMNAVALRPVDKESVGYMELADSVKKMGVGKPIRVRELPDPDNAAEMVYGLIDGLQRFTASLDAGLTEIPAIVTDKTQAEVEEEQIILNAHNIETKPFQYADSIHRLLERNPTLSMGELGARLSKEPNWLYKVLGMSKRLNPDLRALVDDRKIILSNAIEISKLPKEEQLLWMDKAQTMPSGEFTNNVAARMKVIREERAKGRAESPPTFEPVPNQRKWAEVKAEYQNGAPNVIAMLRREKVTEPDAIAKAVVAWMCNMDADSQAQQRQANAAAEEKRKKDTEDRKLERTKQREAEAKKTREELEAKLAQRTTAIPAAAGS